MRFLLLLVGLLLLSCTLVPDHKEPTEAEVLEDARIREFLIMYEDGEAAAAVWTRRFCVSSDYNITAGEVVKLSVLCRRDHLLYIVEVAYVEWLHERKIDTKNKEVK